MKKLLITLVMLISITNAYSQITVTHFNAGWNSANDVQWVEKLSDCDIAKVDIATDPKIQQKHNVVVVPTIIIFQDGEEVKRFQADLSFKIAATREELQDYIDELVMSAF
jgi:thiol-disulfide isomerase/thioredoxin|tara:strand:- start:578 stop:907 length:330 start_codon:yes stop_codon:yes gene_type:complete